MPVELGQIRELLLPGLMERYSFAYNDWRGIWGTTESGLFIPKAPAIITRGPTLPKAIAMGAAAAIIKNPIVTRRFWLGWTNELSK